LNAIVFLYREVLKQKLGWLEDVVRAKRPARLPVGFTLEEAKRVMEKLQGTHWLMASLAGCKPCRLQAFCTVRVCG
jgi:hypothetical protein